MRETKKPQKEKSEMKRKEAKEIARDILQDAIGTAYYKLEEKSYNPEEEKMINEYIVKEAERCLKVLHREYISY